LCEGQRPKKRLNQDRHEQELEHDEVDSRPRRLRKLWIAPYLHIASLCPPYHRTSPGCPAA
jgi:hypothetical protein